MPLLIYFAMKRKYYYYIGGALLVLITVFIFTGKSDKKVEQKVRVKKGSFEILVTTTGELQAQNFENIEGPSELRNRSFRVNDIKIVDLVPEGTVVDSGDYVATLDRNAVSSRLKDLDDEVEKNQSQYTKTELDTSLTLRSLRDELINLKFDTEEKRITVDQSKYEPPATQRQAEISLEKANRDLAQAKMNYILKVEQAKASMKEVQVNLSKSKRERDELIGVLNKFVIYAPKPGMVIYYKEWGGDKRKVGSSISAWDLTVATLPDLSAMNSKCYVNEIDISKVKAGQKVRISVDAFPEKKYTGVVTYVANIGEQLPNADAKVFEVTIKVNEYDPILRPAMTTGNLIEIAKYKDKLFLPLEAVHGGADSTTFVYTTEGKKKIVMVGSKNDTHIIIDKGLEDGEEVYLSIPDGADKFKVENAELIPLIKARIKKEREDEAVRQFDLQKKMEEKDKARNTTKGGVKDASKVVTSKH
jgi:Membrane-fusion protein